MTVNTDSVLNRTSNRRLSTPARLRDDYVFSESVVKKEKMYSDGSDELPDEEELVTAENRVEPELKGEILVPKRKPGRPPNSFKRANHEINGRRDSVSASAMPGSGEKRKRGRPFGSKNNLQGFSPAKRPRGRPKGSRKMLVSESDDGKS